VYIAGAASAYENKYVASIACADFARSVMAVADRPKQALLIL
jgi:hypothetical protein